MSGLGLGSALPSLFSVGFLCARAPTVKVVIWHQFVTVLSVDVVMATYAVCLSIV